MNKAKIKFNPNNFEIIEEGDYVVCAVSGKICRASSRLQSDFSVLYMLIVFVQGLDADEFV